MARGHVAHVKRRAGRAGSLGHYRLLVSATGAHRTEGFPYALDNGAWTAHQARTPWDEAAFRWLVESLGAGADWVVAPDVVAGGRASLDRSIEWLEWCLDRVPRVLLAVQDGMDEAQIARHLGQRVGVFVGGSTEFKERTLAAWCALARERGAWCHVGRVNSERRITACLLAGADSFDGTSASKYQVTLARLDRARRQGVLAWGY